MKEQVLKISCLLVFAFLFHLFQPANIHAQTEKPTLDANYIPERIATKKTIPYTQVREADAMWTKRIWRTLNLQEKLNHPLYYPEEEILNRKSLFQVIKLGIREGSMTAYGNAAFDDEFQTPLTKTEAEEKLVVWQTSYREDPETGELFPDSTPVEIKSYSVKQYWLKEDWFFDRERSVMDVRILGICPIQEKMEEDGITFKGYLPLFWIYFPEARYVLVNQGVFNTFNDAERMSYDDLFWKRIFASYIRKESNVFDRTIQDYKGGNIDMLLEAERVKYEIIHFEHDMWHY